MIMDYETLYLLSNLFAPGVGNYISVNSRAYPFRLRSVESLIVYDPDLADFPRRISKAIEKKIKFRNNKTRKRDGD